MSDIRYIEIARKYFALKLWQKNAQCAHLLFQDNSSLPVLHHAMASPLNAILLESELALEQKLPKELKSKFKHIYSAADMLKSSIETLLKFEVEKAQFSPTVSARKITAFFENKAKGIQLTLHINVEKKNIYGSSLLFEEVLKCLVKNALEAYPKTSKNKFVLLKLSIVNRYLCVKVADFGQGMNFFERKIALLKGVTFKSSGSGLGLFLVRSVVRKFFKGKVSLLSYPGLGTAVYCYFPLEVSAST